MAQYRIERETSPEKFEKRVLPFLLKQEALYCLPIGLISQLVNDPTRYKSFMLGTVLENEKICGVFWQTPPHPLGFTSMPKEALTCLFESLKNENFSSFLAPLQDANYFLELLSKSSNKTSNHKMAQGIYQLTEVTSNHNAPEGVFRCVDESDQALLEQWSFDFSNDVHMPCTLQEATQFAERAIRDKNRFLFILNNKPVCMAGVSGSTPNGIRINWVYTPPELRGNGYASKLVAELSQQMLNQGKKFCFLYTDLANPTSNKIYQRIGYKHVGDSVHYHLS